MDTDSEEEFEGFSEEESSQRSSWVSSKVSGGFSFIWL